MRRLMRRAGGSAAAVVVAIWAMMLVPVTHAVAADGPVTITGHGYGHGRGMGQYGAYGYAVNYGWSYSQILSHYYSNATLGSAGARTIDVEISELTNQPAIICGPGLTVNGAAVGTGCVRADRSGAGTYALYRAASYTPGQDPGWAAWQTLSAGMVVASTADQSVLTNLPRIWLASNDSRGYRGSFVITGSTTQYLLNRVDSESYLRGTVPRESPASWGSAGGGKGMQALEAQAVAARSYALSGSPRTSGAITCDTTSCQVYGGAYSWGTGLSLENSLTDQAIAATANQVMLLNGSIARTEYSSSTGGWTTGGTFPAVVDDGDATSNNPYHDWSTSTTRSAIASQLGVGEISSITVTGRNGLGADGGRVTQVTVRTVAGSVTTYTGTTFQSKLGLRSDWFSVGMTSSTEAAKVVQALYSDILGRGVDSAGMATWTGQIAATGSALSTATAVSYSDERLTTFVAAQYRSALKREPEPNGLVFWVHLLQSGWTVPDLQAGVYGSDEALATLGHGDMTTWVKAMYVCILNRQAGNGEAAWWVDYANKHGRQAAVAGISHSEEAARYRLELYYATMLGRTPDQSGYATFVPILMAGRGDLIVPAGIGGSPEYWARAQSRF